MALEVKVGVDTKRIMVSVEATMDRAEDRGVQWYRYIYIVSLLYLTGKKQLCFRCDRQGHIKANTLVKLSRHRP